MEVMAREARLQQRRLQPALHANLGCSVSLQDLTSPTGPGNLERHCTHASKNLLPPLKPASSAAATSRRMRQGPLCMMSGPGRAGQRKHRLVPAASTLCLRLVSPRMLPCRQKGMQATQKSVHVGKPLLVAGGAHPSPSGRTLSACANSLQALLSVLSLVARFNHHVSPCILLDCASTCCSVRQRLPVCRPRPLVPPWGAAGQLLPSQRTALHL